MSIKKYFGTDGIRGRVGEAIINPEFFLKLGWAIGVVLNKKFGEAKVLVEATAEGQATVSGSVVCGLSSGEATIDVLQSEWHMPLKAGWNWIGYVMSEVKYREASYPGGNPGVSFATPPDPSIFIPVNSISDILTSIDKKNSLPAMLYYNVFNVNIRLSKICTCRYVYIINYSAQI